MILIILLEIGALIAAVIGLAEVGLPEAPASTILLEGLAFVAGFVVVDAVAALGLWAVLAKPDLTRANALREELRRAAQPVDPGAG